MTRFSVSILGRAILLMTAGLFLISRVLAQDIIPLVPSRIGGNPADQNVSQSPVNVFVNVRELNGLALDNSANVTLNCPLSGLTLSGPAKGTSTVQFMHVPVGDCNVEVTSNGFKRA